MIMKRRFFIIVFVVLFAPIVSFAKGMDFELKDDITVPDMIANGTDTMTFSVYDSTGKWDGTIVYCAHDDIMTKLDTSYKIIWTKSSNADISDDVQKKLVDSNSCTDKSPCHIISNYDNEGKMSGYIVLFSDLKTKFIMRFLDLNLNLLKEYSLDSFYERTIDELDSSKYRIVRRNDFIYVLNYISDRAENPSELFFYMYDKNTLELKKNFFVGEEAIGTFSFDTDKNVNGIFFYDGMDTEDIFNIDLLENMKFQLKSNYYLWEMINTQNVNGVYDGYFSFGKNKATFNKREIIRLDVNGKVLWNTEFKYDLYDIVEDYDENHELDGYLILAADSDKKVHLLRYLYKEYEIISKDNDNGTISVSDTGRVGEKVTIKVEPKDGYKLKKIIVTDSNGDEIEVSSDGTFIMPDSEVTISTVFEKIDTIISNPETSSFICIVLGITAISILGIVVVKSK